MAPYEQMWAYVDESQAAQATSAFVSTIWFTAHRDMWHSIIRDERDDERFGYEMHFHKVGCKQGDWRFRVLNRVAGKLLQYGRSWYARSIYVSDDMVKAWRELAFTTNVHTYMIGQLLRKFGGYAVTRNLSIVIDGKKQHSFDHTFVSRLQSTLTEEITQRGGPVITVQASASTSNDLLQVADLLSGAVRYWYVGRANDVTNPNKATLADRLATVRDSRIKVWEWPF